MDSWEMFGAEHYLPPRRGRKKLIPLDWRQANVFDLALRDGWTCAYCGCPLEAKGRWDDDPAVEPPTVDHVVPRKRGGGDTNYNAVLACMSCNLRKRTRHPAVMFA